MFQPNKRFVNLQGGRVACLWKTEGDHEALVGRQYFLASASTIRSDGCLTANADELGWMCPHEREDMPKRSLKRPLRCLFRFSLGARG